jgi:hypothetical protein
MASVKRYIQPRLNFPIQTVSTSKNSHQSSTHSCCQSRDTADFFRSDRKRNRDASPIHHSKKSKHIEMPKYQMMISLIDEDMPICYNFRCFHEDSLFPSSIFQSLVQNREEDDDCQTLEEDISLCNQYISIQLEQAILNAEINA